MSELFPLGLDADVFVCWLLQSLAQWGCQDVVFWGSESTVPLLAQGNDVQL